MHFASTCLLVTVLIHKALCYRQAAGCAAGAGYREAGHTWVEPGGPVTGTTTSAWIPWTRASPATAH